jgi:hypothetical protein
MANRRTLKRNINFICSELFAECIASSLYSGKPDKDNVDTLLKTILKLQSDYISRISHTEPNIAKVYYKSLIRNFNKAVDEIIDHINNLN